MRKYFGKGKIARWLGRGWAKYSYARHVEPTWLEVNRHRVQIADLSAGFAGLTVLQMSDFHGGAHLSQAYLRESVAVAMAQQPDVIVLTGDYIHKGFKHVDMVANVLGELNAPLGVFAVLGNHDYSVRNALGFRRYPQLHAAVHDALAAQGIHVLRNETHVLRKGEERLYLSGVDDLWSRSIDLDAAFANLDADVPRLVLAHNPCTIERLHGRRCDLMLSGHTHGGQVKLPWWGPLALGPKGRRFTAGFYQVQSTQLYVNKGVGFGLRLRYQVRPEIAVFTLASHVEST